MNQQIDEGELGRPLQEESNEGIPQTYNLPDNEKTFLENNAKIRSFTLKSARSILIGVLIATFLIWVIDSILSMNGLSSSEFTTQILDLSKYIVSSLLAYLFAKNGLSTTD